MRTLGVGIVLLAAVPLVARAEPTPWAGFRTPTANPPRSIGGYSAGCIEGAVALPKAGDGFRVAKPERNRVFGHPLLVGLIRDLGKQLVALKAAPLSVGDLGQPRGGPAPTGHASHQTGLDVDLWFLPPVDGSAVSMVDHAKMQPSPKFSAAVMRLLSMTAADARVERIFVNPVLKRAMCERPADGGDRAWLRKLRPWWGHDDHFHVRLACPADSPACTAQTPLPPGDGCGELAWWFDTKAQADRDKSHQTYSSKVGAAPPLPEGCQVMLASAEQDTARYEAWMKEHGKTLADKAREEVALRAGDWGFFEHNLKIGDAQDRLALDRAGHVLTPSENGDWLAFLSQKGLSATEALKRVAWLYRGSALEPKDSASFKHPFTPSTLVLAPDGTVTLSGWIWEPPGALARVVVTATPKATTMKWESAK